MSAQSEAEVQAYLDQHKVQHLVEEAINAAVKASAADPAAFMAQHFSKGAELKSECEQPADGASKRAAGPIVYEVNIDVDADTADEFEAWLVPHAAELLAIDECRFTGAEVFVKEAEPDAEAGARKTFAVHYRLEDRAGLQAYLDTHAPRLRGDGARSRAER